MKKAAKIITILNFFLVQILEPQLNFRHKLSKRRKKLDSRSSNEEREWAKNLGVNKKTQEDIQKRFIKVIV